MTAKKKKKRPFARLKGVSDETDAYAIEHNRRPFVFGFTTEKGTAVHTCGSVPVSDVEKFLSVFETLIGLDSKKS